MKNLTGTNKFRGVNPANGIVIYYNLPELKKTDEITMEIKDSEGNIVRTFTSKADEDFKKWDGGPRGEPTLSKNKGLKPICLGSCAIATMPGVPNVYIESSYAGHKALPGKYSFTLKMGEQRISTEAEILPNPMYPTNAATYKEYHS